MRIRAAAIAVAAVSAIACTSGSGKPSPSASATPTVAATLRVRVAGANREQTEAASAVLVSRLTALGNVPVTTTVEDGTITFGLPRAASGSEVAVLRAQGRLAFRPVLKASPPTGCGARRPPADKNKPLVACDADGTATYVLGPAELTGNDVRSATATSLQGATRPQWVVTLSMKSAKKWADLTEKFTGHELAIVVDDVVQSAPTINERIPDGTATISGGFSEETARALAVSISGGGLPLPVAID